MPEELKLLDEAIEQRGRNAYKDIAAAGVSKLVKEAKGRQRQEKRRKETEAAAKMFAEAEGWCCHCLQADLR